MSWIKDSGRANNSRHIRHMWIDERDGLWVVCDLAGTDDSALYPMRNKEVAEIFIQEVIKGDENKVIYAEAYRPTDD